MKVTIDISYLNLAKEVFLAEITAVLRCAIYAHLHDLQLVLINESLGFKYKYGWGDYYEYFCQEYHPKMDSKVVGICSAVTKVKMREIRGHTPDSLLGPITIKGFSNIMFFIFENAVLAKTCFRIRKNHLANFQ